MINRKLQYAIVALVLLILAMGFYLVHLKRKAESTTAAPPAQTLAPPPPSGPTQQMTLYVASDDEGTLRTISISSALPTDPSERARLALHTLIARCVQAGSPHPLGAGADIKQVYLVDPASAVVNLNTAFADSHRSGVQVEQLSVFSMVLTLKAELPAITRVRFLVDGKSRETLAGHVDLGGWLDVALVAEAAQQQLAMAQP